jgi:hypothetical protein
MGALVKFIAIFSGANVQHLALDGERRIQGWFGSVSGGSCSDWADVAETTSAWAAAFWR